MTIQPDVKALGRDITVIILAQNGRLDIGRVRTGSYPKGLQYE